MPLQVRCPACKKKFAVADDQAGKQVRCTSCKQSLQIPAAAPAPRPEVAYEIQAEAPQPKPSERKGPPPLKTSSRAADRDDDEPRSRRRRRREEEAGTPWLLLGAAGAGAGVLLFGVVIAVFLFAGSEPVPEPMPVEQVQLNPPVAAPPPVAVNPPPAPPVQPIAPPPGMPVARPRKGVPAPVAPAPVATVVKVPPADRSRVPIKPPALARDKVVRQLPDTISEITVGGGGRFLIAHLPRLRQLAVFDANEGRVVKYLPVPSDSVKLAAGLDKLIVVVPESRLLQRWDLLTLERETTTNLPAQFPPSALAMGSASNGPLLVQCANGPAFQGETFVYDIRSLQRIDLPELKNRIPIGTGAVLRASPDGRVFAVWAQHGSAVLSFDGAGARLHGGNGFNPGGPTGLTIPGPDGKTLFGMGGLRTLEGRQLTQHANLTCVPGQSGNNYLAVQTANNFGPQPAKNTTTVTLYIQGDTRPLLNLSDVDLGTRINQFGQAAPDPVAIDRRLQLVPEAKLLIAVPLTNDRLVLHRFDVEAALAKSDIDYLFVASAPPGLTTRGRTYEYSPVVKSKQGGVKLRLDSGPNGMMVSDGRLSWTVRADQPDGDADVILTVTDKSGQEVFHVFKVTVVQELPAEVAEANPAPPPAPREEKKPVPEPAPLAKAPSPTPGPPPLVAPKLEKERVELGLPAAYDDAVVGGGGRFVLLNLPKLRKVALFDVNEAKVVHYFPVAQDDVKLAAGMTKLIMVFPGTGIVQRWDLVSRERELTQTLANASAVKMALLGSASEGPLVLTSGGTFGRGGVEFLDLKTLQPLNLGKVQQIHSNLGEGYARASADGTVFTCWRPSVSPQGVISYVLSAGKLQTHYQHDTVGHIVPAPDGKFLYTAQGILDPTGRALSQPGDKQARVYLLPSVQGNFYLRLPLDGGELYKSGFTVHMVGDSRPLTQIPYSLADFGRGPGPTGTEAFNPWDREAFGNDKRLLFIPDAKLLVILPFTNDKLVLRRLDIEEALAKSGIDYLFVISRPPATITAGTTFAYPLAVTSKAGGVKYRLEAGPEGMRIDAQGLVTWPVPAEAPGEEVNVIVTVSDGGGQEVFHTFKLRVIATAR